MRFCLLVGVRLLRAYLCFDCVVLRVSSVYVVFVLFVVVCCVCFRLRVLRCAFVCLQLFEFGMVLLFCFVSFVCHCVC